MSQRWLQMHAYRIMGEYWNNVLPFSRAFISLLSRWAHTADLSNAGQPFAEFLLWRSHQSKRNISGCTASWCSLNNERCTLLGYWWTIFRIGWTKIDNFGLDTIQHNIAELQISVTDIVLPQKFDPMQKILQHIQDHGNISWWWFWAREVISVV